MFKFTQNFKSEPHPNQTIIFFPTQPPFGFHWIYNKEFSLEGKTETHGGNWTDLSLFFQQPYEQIDFENDGIKKGILQNLEHMDWIR